jgi:predicted dehydrogenase
MTHRITRRQFTRQSLAAAGLSFGVWSSRSAVASRAAGEKLGIAYVGTSGQAGFSIDNLRGENTVALCDIDDRYLDSAATQFPQAKKYNDFRKMLEQKDIDAVVVCTPDHIHAPATLAALRLGKHVYCEKPLTHTVEEARLVAETAAKHKVATQMGTQIHAGDNYRRVVEIIQSGAIGKVAEIHTWAGREWGGGERPKDTPEAPKLLHWELWLGPAPVRPYHPTYLPRNWRKWWDFGGGNLNDMACHHMDLPFWAVGLRHPTTIEAEGPPLHPETCPLGLTVRYEHAARGDQPAVKLTWYDGTQIPREIHGVRTGGGGNLFVGDKGMMYADYGGYRLYPEKEFADYNRPKETIPRSIGHHAEWVKAAKEGTPTTCNFDYAGALTEAVLLGTVSYRCGKKLTWDPKKLSAGVPEAEPFLRKKYRAGWGIS